MGRKQIQDTDVGTDIRVLVKELDGSIPPVATVKDISSYTTKEIEIMDPDETITAYAASFVTDGTDGLLKYVTTTAIFSGKAGTWRRRAHLAKTGEDFTGINWIPFDVKEDTSK